VKIGALAKATDMTVETIRYYEREGLLPAAPRNAVNYRLYEADHVERLSFIRHCRSLGMALDEIRALLSFKDQPSGSCGEVNALLDAHIDHVAQRLDELKALQRQLKSLRKQCGQAQATGDCGILKGLSGAAPLQGPHPQPHPTGGLHGDKARSFRRTTQGPAGR